MEYPLQTYLSSKSNNNFTNLIQIDYEKLQGYIHSVIYFFIGMWK